MAKKTEVVDAYIRVDVQKSYYRRGPDLIKEVRHDLAEMAGQIKRHIDNVSSVIILEEKESTCEFCGSQWTETSNTYNGGCCDEDEANNPNP